MKTSPTDILVIISHPFGDVETSLEDWIRTGPGPRPLVRPVAVKQRHTGERLPLRVIPLRYRNNSLSRALIKFGLLPDPWLNVSF